MITIIIPALNEEEHIASVISQSWSHPDVNEVIVVDDNSSDNTVEISRNLGAKIIISSRIGKGTSMKEGINAASNDIVCFLDGDIEPYPEDTIKLLTDPILNNEADFVKSAFNRNAGRVTELVAKPLLSIFFPELVKYNQPLSGMIAGRRSVLESIDFMDDYGVDIGILIDMHLRKVRCREVDIGYIENKSKPWESLGKMSREVARAIIMKASTYRMSAMDVTFEDVLEGLRNRLENELGTQIGKTRKLILFDMDNTLLAGRFIDYCSETYGFKEELLELRSFEEDSILLTKRIARLLRGKPLTDLLTIVEKIPVVKGAKEIIGELKKRGYLVGIISDSYDCITEYLKKKLAIDFAISNELEFSNSICTGEVKIPSYFFKDSSSLCNHAICKTNALLMVLRSLEIDNENTIVVGDSLTDLCMIKNAGRGVSFNSTENVLDDHADLVIKVPSFSELLILAR